MAGDEQAVRSAVSQTGYFNPNQPTPSYHLVLSRRPRILWGNYSAAGLRGYGIDFGRFAICVLLDSEISRVGAQTVYTHAAS